MNGVVSAAGSSGSVIGPLLGAVLALQDLRTPFIVVGCTATIAGLAALVFLPSEQPALDGERRHARPPSGVTDLVPDAADPAIAAAEDGRRRSSLGARRAAGEARAVERRVQRGVRRLDHDLRAVLDAGAGAEPSDVALFFVPFGGRARSCSAPRSRGRRTERGAAGWSRSAPRLVFTNIASARRSARRCALIYGTAVVAGGGLAAAQSSWFALLGVATDGGRRGRSFGLVSALSNLGVIAGARWPRGAWSTIGLREG